MVNLRVTLIVVRAAMRNTLTLLGGMRLRTQPSFDF